MGFKDFLPVTDGVTSSHLAKSFQSYVASKDGELGTGLSPHKSTSRLGLVNEHCILTRDANDLREPSSKYMTTESSVEVKRIFFFFFNHLYSREGTNPVFIHQKADIKQKQDLELCKHFKGINLGTLKNNLFMPSSEECCSTLTLMTIPLQPNPLQILREGKRITLPTFILFEVLLLLCSSFPDGLDFKYSQSL